MSMFLFAILNSTAELISTETKTEKEKKNEQTNDWNGSLNFRPWPNSCMSLWHFYAKRTRQIQTQFTFFVHENRQNRKECYRVWKKKVKTKKENVKMQKYRQRILFYMKIDWSWRRRISSTLTVNYVVECQREHVTRDKMVNSFEYHCVSEAIFCFIVKNKAQIKSFIRFKTHPKTKKATKMNGKCSVSFSFVWSIWALRMYRNVWITGCLVNCVSGRKGFSLSSIDDERENRKKKLIQSVWNEQNVVSSFKSHRNPPIMTSVWGLRVPSARTKNRWTMLSKWSFPFQFVFVLFAFETSKKKIKNWKKRASFHIFEN